MHPFPCGRRRVPTRSLGRWCAAVFALALSAGQAAPVDAQRIRGTVLDVVGRRPVPDAAVTVRDSGGVTVLRALTDSAGRFASPLPRAGEYSLHVEKLGYRALETESFTVALSESLELRILVGVDAVPLAPVEVTARRRESSAHPDFDRRVDWGRRSGSGRYFTRDELDRTAFVRVSSVLLNVPSIRLIHDADGNVYLGSSERGTFNCRPAVFLNGMEVDQSLGLDGLVGLDDLDGIEIYRFRSEVPTELARPGVCSAVSFWTRTGRGDRSRSVGRILLGIGLAGAIIVIGFAR